MNFPQFRSTCQQQTAEGRISFSDLVVIIYYQSEDIRPSVHYFNRYNLVETTRLDIYL